MAKNKFSKALKHLKSTELDEKTTNESPTNSIGGVYALKTGFRLSREVDLIQRNSMTLEKSNSWNISEYIRPAGIGMKDLEQYLLFSSMRLLILDFSYSTQTDNPRNTKTIIDEILDVKL